MGKDPGQRGNPTGATAINFCWQAIGGWTDFVGLQYSKRIDSAFGVAITRRQLKEYSHALSEILSKSSKFKNRSDSIYYAFLFSSYYCLIGFESIFHLFSILFECLQSAFLFPFFACNCG